DRHLLREDGPRHHHGCDLQALQDQPRQEQDARQRRRRAPRNPEPGRPGGRARPLRLHDQSPQAWRQVQGRRHHGRQGPRGQRARPIPAQRGQAAGGLDLYHPAV
ncbi:MAG: hypothetical protein AVDCRST_MAG05-1132, partial [uncultured Rubrobacteraceae bacterium]